MRHPREILAQAGLWAITASYNTTPFSAFGIKQELAFDIEREARQQISTTYAWLSKSSFCGLSWAELLTEGDVRWINRLGARLSIVNTKSSADWTHGLLIFGLVKAFSPLLADGGTFVDFGTARGYSALVATRAMLSEVSNPRVVSFDILPHTTKQYWGSVDDVNGPKTRQEIWKDYTESKFVTFVQGPISVSSSLVHLSQIPIAFLDSAHTFEQVKKELDYVTARQSIGHLIIFDDFGSSSFSAVTKAARSHSFRKSYKEETFETASGKIIGVWIRVEA